ncbi:AMP-binding enzyme [Ancylostoma ceylanicum]|uniref:AMP-binding enzyme n=3 Tax=Ancylostoma ceylanicum TaxID=53326 RepID=A0A0D6LZ09_9BILA|nr:AMP-binding enzyme [Ancylostoma ceylanicum]EYB85933.1 hypothetical protein Y032_0288g1483 [Ancylostoma ceylanicum]
MVLKSPSAEVPVCDTPLHEKVLAAVLRNIDRNPDRIAFISAEDPSASITFKEVYGQAHSVANFLSKRGHGHLDVCCQVMQNCIEYAVFYLGALLCGGAISGVSAMFTTYELERQFVDSHCKVVITDEAHLNKVLLATKRCPEVKTIICIRSPGSTHALPPAVVSWDDVIKTPVSALPKYNYSPDDMALLPYSSGTTGSPKGVVLTHRNFTTMLDIVNSHFDNHIVSKLGDSDWDYHNENLLLMLPFYHIYGFGLMNQTLITGTTGIVFAKFDPTVFLNAIQTYKPKMLMLVPPILLLLTKHPMTSNYDLSSLQFVLTGAAPAGKDLCDEFLNKYKHVRYLAQAYGMTECGMASHLPPLDSRSNFLTVGTLISTFEQKIISTSTGNEVPIGERGEICVRSPTIMKGYLNRPEATAEMIDSEGWLHTGDIGFVDEKGQTFIVDRLKELIKVKGLQVAPAELEDILLSHKEIHDAAVIGVPDEKTGEKPRAYVVSASKNLTEADVKRFVEEKVSTYKFLTGGVVFVKEIPKSPSGKILRRFLRDRAAAELVSKL